MATQDTCCTIVPYFKVHEGKLDDFKKMCEEFVRMTDTEHLDNVGALLQEALKISDLTRLEIHGPEQEVAKMREPLAGLNPQFFVLEYGFRR